MGPLHRLERKDRSFILCPSHLSLNLLQDLTLLLQLQDVPLLLVDLSGPLEDHLEALLTACGILLEALYGELLNAVLNLLPTTTQSGDLGALSKLCLGW